MTENQTMCGIQVGQKVPDFTLSTYQPTEKNFGEFKLSENMKAKKWTILFFYPADFTFV
jgi:peroxiredoxin (alkyl hydroperoxide reductase subunit C)